MAKPTKETLAAVCSYLATDPVLAHAMRHVGLSENLIFLWFKRSRETDPATDDRWCIRWPDPEGQAIPFHQAVNVARQMQIATMEATLRRDVTQGVPRILRTQSGEVVWEVDAALVAEFEGDADAARIFGHHDPFFLHDENGARIPVTVTDPAPAALRIHASRSLIDGWNPSERKEVDTRHSGGVLILKASRQGVAPPPYARPEAKPMSPLQADLVGKLQDLRERGPVNTKPDRPVNVGGRSSRDDPPEQTSR